MNKHFYLFFLLLISSNTKAEHIQDYEDQHEPIDRYKSVESHEPLSKDMSIDSATRKDSREHYQDKNDDHDASMTVNPCNSGSPPSWCN